MQLVMVLLLAYQVFMPAVDNGKYQVVSDPAGPIRVNTQNGTMVRCNDDLKCPNGVE